MPAANPAMPEETLNASIAYDDVVVIRPRKLTLQRKFAIMHIMYSLVKIRLVSIGRILYHACENVLSFDVRYRGRWRLVLWLIMLKTMKTRG